MHDTWPGRLLDPACTLQSTRLQDLLDLWRLRRGRRLAPARDDFDSKEFMGFGGNITLIDVERKPLRFRFRLIGSNITRILDRDSTDRYLDELYDRAAYRSVTAGFRECLRSGKPVRCFGRIEDPRFGFTAFEAVEMPLSLDGVTIGQILRGSDFRR